MHGPRSLSSRVSPDITLPVPLGAQPPWSLLPMTTTPTLDLLTYQSKRTSNRFFNPDAIIATSARGVLVASIIRQPDSSAQRTGVCDTVSHLQRAPCFSSFFSVIVPRARPDVRLPRCFVDLHQDKALSSCSSSRVASQRPTCLLLFLRRVPPRQGTGRSWPVPERELWSVMSCQTRSCRPDLVVSAFSSRVMFFLLTSPRTPARGRLR